MLNITKENIWEICIFCTMFAIATYSAIQLLYFSNERNVVRFSRAMNSKTYKSSVFVWDLVDEFKKGIV